MNVIILLTLGVTHEYDKYYLVMHDIIIDNIKLSFIARMLKFVGLISNALALRYS